MTEINIQLVKFTSGEEVLTEVKSLTGSTIKIKRPIRVVIMPPDKNDPQQKPKIGFSAFLPYAEDEEFTLDRKDILLVAKPVEAFIDQYKDIFGLRTSLFVPNFGNSNDPLAATKGFDALAAIRAASEKN